MTNLRKLARGRECQVRLDCCNRDSSTVVLAHLRLMGISGIGLKTPDILAAHCCVACHAQADSDHSTETQLAFARGIFRTQAALVKEGILKW
jgi:Protein of unknown function (DUF1364)